MKSPSSPDRICRLNGTLTLKNQFAPGSKCSIGLWKPGLCRLPRRGRPGHRPVLPARERRSRPDAPGRSGYASRACLRSSAERSPPSAPGSWPRRSSPACSAASSWSRGTSSPATRGPSAGSSSPRARDPGHRLERRGRGRGGHRPARGQAPDARPGRARHRAAPARRPAGPVDPRRGHDRRPRRHPRPPPGRPEHAQHPGPARPRDDRLVRDPGDDRRAARPGAGPPVRARRRARGRRREAGGDGHRRLRDRARPTSSW